jgi:formate dehydrogenase beta subunit
MNSTLVFFPRTATVEKSTQKYRTATLASHNAIESLLADSPRDKQFLIEYLHRIQDTHGHISADRIAALADALKLSQVEVFEVATFYHHFDVVAQGAIAPARDTVRVCNGLSCAMAGAGELFTSLKHTCGADLDSVRVIHAPCVGQCDHAPMAVVNQLQVKNASVPSVMENLAAQRVAGNIAPGDVNVSTSRNEIGNENGNENRKKNVSANNNSNNNANTCGAVSSDLPAMQMPPFLAFERCVSGAMSREAAIAILDVSNVRGLGGAGFPAGRKWKIVRGFKGVRALVVNADEGEPGTFKDRYYLERNPWQFWEGVLIAAWAVEARDVYVYLRDEYHDVRREMTLQVAALQAYLRRGFGVSLNVAGAEVTREGRAFPHPNPLPRGEGTKVALPEGEGGKPENAAPHFHPNIELRRGAGAYICGEESALIESIEGKRGIPRLRPPYIAEVGVFGRPTLAHNVETLYWIPEILNKGAAWWNAHGRNGRSGLRSFSVSGRVKNPGVKLAPAGISVRELIDEFCGGMVEGHTLYGYLPGGASGGILPASLEHLPLDFDTLQPYGCFIGSAAVIVLSQHDRARDAALNMMQFFEHESCGQCTPCRAGTAKAAQLMARPKWDESLLKSLSQTMMDASICGLGQAAPNPMITAMKYFPHEFT